MPKNIKKSQSIVKGALILTASTLIVKILGAFFKIPIGKILGGVGNSYFEAAYALYNPVDALAVAGLPVAISRCVSENVAKKRFHDVRLIHKISIPIFITTGTIGFLIMFLASFYYTKFLNSPNAIFSVFALSPTILFSCLMSIYRGYYQGLRNMYPTAISELIEAVSKLVLGLFFASSIISYAFEEFKNKGTVFGKICKTKEMAENIILPFASAGAILGITIGAFLGFLFLFIKHKKYSDCITNEDLEASPPPKNIKTTIKTLLAIAIPIGFGALITNIGGLIDTIVIRRQLFNIMNYNSDIILKIYQNNIPKDKILNKEVHDFLSGCFAYVSSIVMLIPGVTQMFGISALPSVTSAFTLKNNKKLKRNIKTILKFTAVFAIPSGVGISFFGLDILKLLYGDERFREINIASKVVVVLGLSAIFTAMSLPICSILQAIGRVDLPVKLMLIGVFIKIVVNYFFVGIPSINIMGAGFGTFFCYTFVFFFSLYFLFKECKVSIDVFDIIIRPIFACVFCTIFSKIALDFFKKFLNQNLSVILMLFVFTTIYIIAIFIMKIIEFKDFKNFKLIEKNKKSLHN